MNNQKFFFELNNNKIESGWSDTRLFIIKDDHHCDLKGLLLQEIISIGRG
jgi:hypothetical protein